MRGIPRAAVAANLPVVQARSYRARDIADPSSICGWNPDMYGVDMTQARARETWYDGRVRGCTRRWGVDFVKMDDMSSPL